MLKLAGSNNFCQINDDVSKKNSQNESIIHPNYSSTLKVSSLLSYSICYNHSVCITSDNSIKAVGDNSHHQIWDSLPKQVINEWKEFEIQDVYGNLFTPLSAVCGQNYTLYLARDQQEDKSLQLIFACYDKNKGLPIFLSLEGRKPVSIYGGLTRAAAIDEEGSIIVIDDNVFINQSFTPLFGSLPEGEKAISIACCDESFFALSSNGNVYVSEKPFGNQYSFTKVPELENVKIINISGLSKQILLVSQFGEVYGRGDSGIIGFGKEGETIKKFTKNKELKKFVIKEAYAGSRHSLFLTNNGKVLSCGYDDTGALLIDGELSNKCISSPVETVIKENASFCIAGVGISAVFVGCKAPENCPNRQTQEMEVTVNQSRCCILI